jgi:hypothetical protein
VPGHSNTTAGKKGNTNLMDAAAGGTTCIVAAIVAIPVSVFKVERMSNRRYGLATANPEIGSADFE